MRIVFGIRILGLALLLTPGSMFAASREMQEMQRDIAQLQDQVRTLQSGFDSKISALQTLVQQALDAGNKTNTSVSVLSSSVNQTLDRELKDRLTPVAGLSTKVDNLGSDVSEVRNSVADLNAQINRMQQLLTDINNGIKVIQAPPAAPPPSNLNPDSPGAMGAAGAGPAMGPGGVPPVPAQALYTNATRDMQGGKADLAASEFADFVRFYPEDPNASAAQFYIGQIHYGQNKLDQAVKDFDAVLERFPDNKLTPDAYFMKGMALKQTGHRDAGAAQFRALILKYPRSDRAPQAAEQLKSMGLSASAAVAPARRRR